MALDLVDYERKAHEAVQAFWGTEKLPDKSRSSLEKLTKGSAQALPVAKTWTGS